MTRVEIAGDRTCVVAVAQPSDVERQAACPMLAAYGRHNWHGYYYPTCSCGAVMFSAGEASTQEV